MKHLNTVYRAQPFKRPKKNTHKKNNKAMKNSFTYSSRTARPMSNKTVSFYKRKPITITGNLAVLIALGSITAVAMLLINLGLLGW